jgi:putative transposase
VLDALDTVLVARKPDNVVPHSDRGSQYTSVAFGAPCREAAVGPSTGSAGDAYDNAMCEFLRRTRMRTDRSTPLRSDSKARIAIFRFIEGFYNPSAATPPSLSFAHRIRKET